MAKLAVTPPVVGSVSTTINGSRVFLQHQCRDGAARHLHQADRTFLHARPARGGVNDQRRILQHRELRRRHQPLADRGAHRSAHEIERHGRHHGALAADGAMRHHQRIIQPGACARASFSRSAYRFVSRNTSGSAGTFGSSMRVKLPSSNVQSSRSSALAAHMVAAMRADFQILLQLLGERSSAGRPDIATTDFPAPRAARAGCGCGAGHIR